MIDKIVFVVLLIPMFLSGKVLSYLLFNERVGWQYAFVVLWLLANVSLILKYCWRGDGVLLLRLITFGISHSALLAVLLLYFG